jgi:hypothetical protein
MLLTEASNTLDAPRQLPSGSRFMGKVQNQLQRIDGALAALGSNSNGTSRTMSAAGRRRISLAQKARWGTS